MSTSQHRTRRPTTPGEILKEEFLLPLNMTQRQLADKAGYEVKAINCLVNGRAGVTAAMALALSEVFDTTPRFWINLQVEVDLFDARQNRRAAAI